MLHFLLSQFRNPNLTISFVFIHLKFRNRCILSRIINLPSFKFKCTAIQKIEIFIPKCMFHSQNFSSFRNAEFDLISLIWLPIGIFLCDQMLEIQTRKSRIGSFCHCLNGIGTIYQYLAESFRDLYHTALRLDEEFVT